MDQNTLNEIKNLGPDQKDAFFKWILNATIKDVREYGVNSVVLYRTKRRIRNNAVIRISKKMVGIYKAYKQHLSKEFGKNTDNEGANQQNRTIKEEQTSTNNN